MSNMPIALMEDSPPYLEFEEGAIENRTASIEAGRKVYDTQDMVIITPMGDNKTQVVKTVTRWLNHLKERKHHGMISDKYYDFCVASYEAWKGKRKAPITGTPIEEWPQVNKAQVKSILDANFRTIEDFAKANDEGLGLVGMGARELKRKAIAYLQSAKKHGAVSEKVTSLESQVEAINTEKEAMAARIAELEQQLTKSPVIKAEEVAA